MVVVGCLLVQVSGVWWGTKDEFTEVKASGEADTQERTSRSQKAQGSDIKKS